MTTTMLMCGNCGRRYGTATRIDSTHLRVEIRAQTIATDASGRIDLSRGPRHATQTGVLDLEGAGWPIDFICSECGDPLELEVHLARQVEEKARVVIPRGKNSAV